MTPPWPARRFGNRVLCGRQVAGRYVCQGEIAVIMDFGQGPMTALPAGWMERAPALSGHWELNARARRAAAADNASSSPRVGRLGDFDRSPVRRFPWTRQCPDCNVLAVVRDDVLSS